MNARVFFFINFTNSCHCPVLVPHPVFQLELKNIRLIRPKHFFTFSKIYPNLTSTTPMTHSIPLYPQSVYISAVLVLTLDYINITLLTGFVTKSCKYSTSVFVSIMRNVLKSLLVRKRNMCPKCVFASKQ